MKIKLKETGIGLVRLLPFLIVVVGLLLINRQHRILTPQKIFDFTPTEPFLAMFFLWLLYALKPIAMVLPIASLQVVTGMIFNPFQAILINVLGLVISLNVAYAIGQFMGKDRVEGLLEKSKKGAVLKKNATPENTFYIIVLRAVGVLPMDLVGMFFGSTALSPIKHTVASLIGLMPALLIATFIGISASDPRSPEFLFSIAMKILLIAISLYLFKKKFNGKGKSH